MQTVDGGISPVVTIFRQSGTFSGTHSIVSVLIKTQENYETVPYFSYDTGLIPSQYIEHSRYHEFSYAYLQNEHLEKAPREMLSL